MRVFGSSGVRAEIADMSENMAHRVLRPRRSEMRADAAKDRGGKFLAVVRDRKAADHLKADAVDQPLLQPRQVSAETRQWKMSLW